jgi:ABC-type branched-subunit amino acid transport system permease subunit
VLTPITNGETGLQVRAIRDSRKSRCATATSGRIDQAFGIQEIRRADHQPVRHEDERLPGFYFCAVMLIICFFIAMCIFKSNFGMMLRRSSRTRTG